MFAEALRRHGAVLILVAVSLATVAPSARYGFVYDDVPVVAEDPRIRTLDLPRLVAMPYWNDGFRDRIYRPVTTVSLAANWTMARGAPWPFHLTNILLHAGVVCLVFALARRLLAPGPGPFVAALLFAVHPVHVEAVAGVVGRAELLAAAAYLLAVLIWDGWRTATGGRVVRLAALGAAAAVAYGAKEHALTLPGLLAVLALWRSPTGGRLGAVRASLPALAVTLVVAGLYLAARAAVLGTAFGGGAVAAGIDGLTAGGRALVMLPALLVWMRVLVAPLHLSADYAPDAIIPQLTPGLDHAVALAVVAGVAALAWATRRHAPGVLLGLLWFAVTAAIAANLVFPTGVLVAERVLYLPSVGVALAAGSVVAWLPARRWRWPVLTVAITLLAARSLTRLPVWRDNDAFFAALATDAPASYRSQWMRGSRAFAAGDPRAGEALMLQAIRTYPADPALVAELGMWYLQGGRAADADRFLSAALRADPAMSDVAARAIIARMRAGRADSAAALATRVADRFVSHEAVQVAAFTAFLEAGDVANAHRIAARLVDRDTTRWQPWQLLADASLRRGACAEARRAIARARALAPREAGPAILAARADTTTACRAAP